MKTKFSQSEMKAPLRAKKAWEIPRIVMEHSLVVRAQGPEDAEPGKVDPFIGPLSTSGT
jgi:hypothetical protein